MEIKRNEAATPQWHVMDYAEMSKHDVFSREGWNKTVEWKVLLEHAKRTEGICHLMFENTFPSSLFLASVELLEWQHGSPSQLRLLAVMAAMTTKPIKNLEV